MLTKIILNEIANSQIVSPHLTPEKAKNYIKILDGLDCHSEVGGGLKRRFSTPNEPENPYSNSPFF